MDKTEAERILAALKSGTPLISRHKAAEALEWAMGSRWISVEERMPDAGKLVMTLNYERMDIGCLSDSKQWITQDRWGIAGVTHWQPLPAGPGGAR